MLGAGVGAYNAFASDPLPAAVDLSLFLGFLSYKVSPLQFLAPASVWELSLRPLMGRACG